MNSGEAVAREVIYTDPNQGTDQVWKNVLPIGQSFLLSPIQNHCFKE